MSKPFKYIYDKVQGNDIKKLARKSGTTPEDLPLILNNRETATLVLKALKRDKYTPALVFDWNPAGFNDVTTAQRSCRPKYWCDLTTNGARNYNNVIFTFPNGGSIGTWKQQINANIPWDTKSTGVPNVITTVTRINRVTERDTGTPSSAYDLEDFSDVFD